LLLGTRGKGPGKGAQSCWEAVGGGKSEKKRDATHPRGTSEGVRLPSQCDGNLIQEEGENRKERNLPAWGNWGKAVALPSGEGKKKSAGGWGTSEPSGFRKSVGKKKGQPILKGEKGGKEKEKMGWEVAQIYAGFHGGKKEKKKKILQKKEKKGGSSLRAGSTEGGNKRKKKRENTSRTAWRKQKEKKAATYLVKAWGEKKHTACNRRGKRGPGRKKRGLVPFRRLRKRQ